MRWRSFKGWQRTIYARLILAFIITMLPIYLLSGLMYNWGTSLVKQDIVESAESQAANYIHGLEGALERINVMQFEALNDTFVSYLVNAYDTLEPYRRIELISYVRAKLSSVRYSNDIISDVIVYMPGREIEISADKGYGNLLWPEGTLEEQLASPYQLVERDQQLIMVAYPLERTEQSIPDLIIEVQLNRQEIMRSMNEGLYREYTGSLELAMPYASPVVVGPAEGSEVISEEDYLLIEAESQLFGLKLSHYMQVKMMFQTVNDPIQWFWALLIVAFGAVAIYLIYINRLIHRPLARLVRGFRRVKEGDLDLNIRHDHEDEFRYIYTNFNDMLYKVKLLIQEVSNQQVHLQNAELKQLQSQINPHFLYNCLFSINRLIKMERLEEATTFTDQLARYFQFITRNTRDTIALANEAEHAGNYVALQLFRFSDRVEVRFGALPEEIRPIPVPRLILQPIIENAFVHGLEDALSDGLLIVAFSYDDHVVKVTIEDNGDAAAEHIERMRAKLADNYEGEVTGILNVHRRLRYMYGSGSGLDVAIGEHGGIRVEIRIDIKGGRV